MKMIIDKDWYFNKLYNVIEFKKDGNEEYRIELDELSDLLFIDKEFLRHFIFEYIKENEGVKMISITRNTSDSDWYSITIEYVIFNSFYDLGEFKNKLLKEYTRCLDEFIKNAEKLLLMSKNENETVFNAEW